MDTDEFWALIEATRPPEPDPELHAHALTESLVAAGAEAAVAFQRRFDEVVDALYRWDLWGAVYLLLGGCSDDAFEYARAWLVGEGRATWESAMADPEGWAVALVEQVVAEGTELHEELSDRGLADGEPLLYAAGTAHERLTGEWTPPTPGRTSGDPAGQAWDEDEVEQAFPRLTAALAQAGEAGAIADRSPAADETSPVAVAMRLAQAMQESDAAWAEGDHAEVVRILTPVLDDPTSVEVAEAIGLTEAFEVVTYQGGMSRFICGDPGGAARWLKVVASRPGVSRRVVRGLAQVELAAGNLDDCEQLIGADDLSATDLAILTLAAAYRADHDTVVERARAVRDRLDADARSMHPWDVAGVNVLLGLALVEVGEGDAAMAAASAAAGLIGDAPPSLPLEPQTLIVAAGASRLRGDLAGAERMLGRAWDRLRPDTADMGAAQREAARCHRVTGYLGQAMHWYDRAIGTFRAAGELCQARALERESADLRSA